MIYDACDSERKGERDGGFVAFGASTLRRPPSITPFSSNDPPTIGVPLNTTRTFRPPAARRGCGLVFGAHSFFRYLLLARERGVLESMHMYSCTHTIFKGFSLPIMIKL